MIAQAIAKIVDRGDLSYDEAYAVMNEIMSGQSSEVQNAAYLAALSTKSAKAETIDEITGSAVAMREHALRVEYPAPIMEIVGTGGDHAGSINISTTAAFIVAAAGIKVAKHGNRAASSKSGAADCLEALGVNIDQPPEKCVELLDNVGLCFMFAQKYHAAMKHVGPIRKELGIRTVFNILGPLTNPAHPSHMLLGVYDEYLVEPLAQVLMNLGVQRGMVVYGQDKLDEISVSAPTTVCEFDDGQHQTYEMTPEDFELPRAPRADIVGGDAKFNAKVTADILSGELHGAKRDIVLMNAGAAIYLGGMAESLEAGVAYAAELVQRGAALKKLDALKDWSNR